MKLTQTVSVIGYIDPPMSSPAQICEECLRHELRRRQLISKRPKADDSKGISDSNTACNVSLVTPGVGGPKALYSFNPKMTYAIFGEEEQIFGYQGLKINLRYNHCDMRPGLQITYSKKFKAIGDTEPTDLKSIFEDYLPKSEDSTRLFQNRC